MPDMDSDALQIMREGFKSLGTQFQKLDGDVDTRLRLVEAGLLKLEIRATPLLQAGEADLITRIVKLEEGLKNCFAEIAKLREEVGGMSGKYVAVLTGVATTAIGLVGFLIWEFIKAGRS